MPVGSLAKRSLLQLLRIYSKTAFKYRTIKLKQSFPEFPASGQLIQIITPTTHESYQLTCPKTHEYLGRIDIGAVCVFIDLIVCVGIDNRLRPLILYNEKLCYISGYQNVEKIIQKI